MARSLFLNLPVKDLAASVDFFTQLGFEFNPQFTDENATCMVISDTAFVMLLVEPFFQTFTDKAIADATTVIEAITAISAESRDEVDELVGKAIEAGGLTTGRDAQDHGFMYQREFYDLDGHKWEVLWMDPNFVQ
jgi:predicted lactoylglutathione lyase